MIERVIILRHGVLGCHVKIWAKWQNLTLQITPSRPAALDTTLYAPQVECLLVPQLARTSYITALDSFPFNVVNGKTLNVLNVF